MNDEQKYALIVDQFIDAMNADVDLPIDQLLSLDETELAELLPLLDFATWFKVSSVDIAQEEKRLIKEAVLQRSKAQSQMSMGQLMASSSSGTVENASHSGLTAQQVDELNKDNTVIDIENPNEVVRYLSGRYGIRFFNLLGWVREMITDVISAQPSNTISPVFTRKEKRQEDDNNEEGSR